jgi:MFS family permease
MFFFTWGFVFMDRLAVSFLTPKLIDVFPMNMAQVGKIGTVGTGCYALATILFSLVASRISNPKRVLMFFVGAIGVGAGLCVFIQTYNQLLVARGILGALEGPVLPLIMVIMSKAASEKSFGLDTGIINLGVVIVAIILGPQLVALVLRHAAWQWAFPAYALPIMVIAICIAALVKEVRIEIQATGKNEPAVQRRGMAEFLKYGNVRACSLISILAMSGYWCIMLYAPTYMKEVNKNSIQMMSNIVSTMGVMMIFYAIFIPKLSDNFGRKPILTLCLIMAALGTFLMYLFPGGITSTLAYVICGGILGCVMPVYAIIIPLESVPDHLKASANSFVIGLGEILGGAVFPSVAGSIADRTSLPVMMGVASGLVIIGFFIALFVKETLARKIKTAAAVN